MEESDITITSFAPQNDPAVGEESFVAKGKILAF